MRRLTWFASTTVVLLAAAPALAGGAVWDFEGYHEPGDLVESTTAVAWGHNPQLGTPEDGPYLIYLAPAESEAAAWPGIPEEGLLVGIVEVYEGSYVGAPSFYQAVARFEIPQVPPGDYQVFHCNDPCTTMLGDVVGGWGLRIVGGGNGRSADVIAAEVRKRLPDAPLLSPTPTVGAETPVEPIVTPSSDRLWFWVVGVVAALLVVRMVWTDPLRRFQTASPTPEDQTEAYG